MGKEETAGGLELNGNKVLSSEAAGPLEHIRTLSYLVLTPCPSLTPHPPAGHKSDRADSGRTELSGAKQPIRGNQSCQEKRKTNDNGEISRNLLFGFFVLNKQGSKSSGTENCEQTMTQPSGLGELLLCYSLYI